ncbi:beta-ketoacyl synthase N-terminal-like domain-containing protein [Streptomyces lydicus]|uniref:beta-ketoacyl synthase N-terminal-like domain-containing protein n=1 Tax=Streptomyces lydicus TaxID=47763 RepID=UPI001F50FFDF|nr:beta-ketoacyl synthase N-terminal-like domain-containing protein [Streptomyces lydicus]MCZ1006746.1 beta-ketoacyl synthase N-terminal-like domain-containing protein [Streptomyces lydicus]
MSIPSVQEVVVTGIGLALPGVATYGDLLGPLPGEGGFDPATGLRGRELRHKDRASRLALRAAESVVHDAGLTDAHATFTGVADATAVVVSTNLGNVDSVCEATDTIAREGVRGLSPLGLPQTSSNVVAGWVAIRYGLRGPNLTVCNGTTSGLDALAWARHLIVAGRAEAAVVVGVEPANEVATRLLGEQSTDAAVAIVLEPADAATSRGARPRATIAGYARARDLAAALASTGVTEEGPVGLWLTDEAEAAGAGAGHLLAATRRIDLESQLGPLSGALGVLQCAAAAAHLEGGATGNVLATAGGSRHDATAALLLTPSPATRPSTRTRTTPLTSSPP